MMEKITVRKTSDTTFQVTVESQTTTEHRVTLPHDDYQRLTGGKATPVELIERSFEFLLAREPNTSILRSFELSLISQYFPEFESVIQESL